ncbi:MAG: hypothetical protein AAF962_07935 [Actinomycetota bacterium]
MRRGLASLIMVLSLLVASGSWAGFILTRTVLDPGRSEALADNLLDNTVVRGVIVDLLSDAVETQIPTSVVVPRQTIEAAADEALDDPRVEAVIRDGFVRAHQNALNGVDEPVVLDASALGEVGREKVVAVRPELNAVLPAAPQLEVDLPTGGLSVLGDLRAQVRRYTIFGSLLALFGVTLSFVLTTRRPKALRRVAYWAFANSFFWLAVGYGLPSILERIAPPSSVSIATAVVDVFLGAMIRPAVIMFGVGVALLVVSMAWPALARRRPARLVDREAPVPGALHQPSPVLEGYDRQAGGPYPDPGYVGAAGADYRQYEAPPEPLHRLPAAAQRTPDRTAVYDRFAVPHQDPPTSPYPTPHLPPQPPVVQSNPYLDPSEAPTTVAYGDQATTQAGQDPSAQQPGAPQPSGYDPGGFDPYRTAQAPSRPLEADDPEMWSEADHDAPTRQWSRADDFGDPPPPGRR